MGSNRVRDGVVFVALLLCPFVDSGNVLVTNPSNSPAFETRDLTLTCTTVAYSDVTFTWIYSDGTAIHGGRVVSTWSNGVIRQQSFSFRPDRNHLSLFCTVTGTKASNLSATGAITLDVKYDPDKSSSSCALGVDFALGMCFLSILGLVFINIVVYKRIRRNAAKTNENTSASPDSRSAVVAVTDSNNLNQPKRAGLDRRTSGQLYEQRNVCSIFDASADYERLQKRQSSDYEAIRLHTYVNPTVQPETVIYYV